MPPTLPFARPARVRPPAAPDLAVAALPLLRSLGDALRAAARVRDHARRLDARAARKRGGVPPLFFFHRGVQAEWDAVRSAPGSPAETAPAVPGYAAAWDAVRTLTDDALTVLAACPLTRRAARAVPGLSAAATDLAPDHPRARELADFLALPEDESFLVIHPAARAGFRLSPRGVADVNQFHALLADAVTGPPARGLLPGPRPDPAVLDAYRDAERDSDPPAATARFQLYRPAALRPDGTLPPGFTGSDHWLWGREPLAAVPRVGGERTVLIGDPVVRGSWDAVRALPRVSAELSVTEVLSAAEVSDWLARQTGRPGFRSAWRGAAGGVTGAGPSTLNRVPRETPPPDVP